MRASGIWAVSIVVALSLVGVIGDAALASDRPSVREASASTVVAEAVAPVEHAEADLRVHPSILIIATPERVARVAASLRGATDAVAEGEAALEAAAGRTLDDAAADQLRELVDRLHSTVESTRAALHDGLTVGHAAEVVRASGSASSLAETLDEATTTLDADADAAASSIALLDEAVAAWQLEQDRLAEEARLAEERAAAAAAQAAADAAASESALEGRDDGGDGGTDTPVATATPGPASADWTEYVWTSGFQAELDACAGGVDLSGTYGVRVVGEHWHCGGAGFPTWSGAIVDMSGVISGRYRVEGIAAVLDGATADSNDIPGGFDLLYQTCLNDSQSQMAFVGMTRIG
ncbi:hypothetical protein [Agromyces sp. CF514]|uniref:hypothetical protein n=1 Tax=Agromyces sp. CF514 TaxID=1881031 RepID=UPI000B8618EA|nr:hypothetical protein [Agromyces sp. CF514]